MIAKTQEVEADESGLFSLAGIIEHLIAYDVELPPLVASKYQYVLASCGLMIRARREGVELCLPIAEPTWPVLGLADITPSFHLDYPLVPASHVSAMLERSRAVCLSRRDEDLLENLFYLRWDKAAGGWDLCEPEQEREHASVRPKDDRPESPYGRALIEVHSHHHWAAEASETDDTEELGKFRIFVILGDIFERPSVSVRVCVHEYFIEIPAGCIFELPLGVTDRLAESFSNHANEAC